MAPRKTLNDVVEQLKANNETTVDINTGIAGLENQFGKFFADLKRQQLEDSREAKASRQTANVAPVTDKGSGGGGGMFSGLKKLGFLGGLGMLASGIGSAAVKILSALGPAGVGLGAFFLGLAGAEAIIKRFASADAGEGIKNLLINLSEGLGSFSKKSFVALGTVLAAGVIFPGKTAKGLAAVGIGLGGFLLGLAGSDKLMQMINGDGGENIKKLLQNLAEGLGAFSTESFVALGALLGTGALFGAIPGGAAIAGGVAVGIAAIGAGIGAFLLALGGVTKFASLFGIDGTALKVLLKNMAEGLNELTNIEETDKLLKRIAGLGLVGPAILAAITSFTAAQGIDGLINGAKKVINFITFGAAGLEDQATARKSMIRNLVDAMKPLQEIPKDLGNQLDTLAKSLIKFMNSFNTIADNLNVEKFGKTFLVLGETLAMTRNLVYAMANGGEFKKPGILNKIAGLFGGGKIDFGPEGEGGLLSPTLKTDDLVKQVEKINFVLGKTNVTPSTAPAIAPSNYPDRIQNMTSGNESVVVNSGNTTTNISNASALAVGSSGAIDFRDISGKLILNPSGT
tara:strand:- start:61 stop:1773 length:1713 start_codon:yes stop_codon:yes gene_type:complete